MSGKEFLVVAFCFLACWSRMAILLGLLKDFPSLILKFWQVLLSIPQIICICNVTVSWWWPLEGLPRIPPSTLTITFLLHWPYGTSSLTNWINEKYYMTTIKRKTKTIDSVKLVKRLKLDRAAFKWLLKNQYQINYSCTRCYSFWFCFSLVENLAQNLSANHAPSLAIKCITAFNRHLKTALTSGKELNWLTTEFKIP